MNNKLIQLKPPIDKGNREKYTDRLDVKKTIRQISRTPSVTETFILPQKLG